MTALLHARHDPDKCIRAEERGTPSATLLGGLHRGADGPAAPSAETVEKLDFVRCCHTRKSLPTGRFLT